MEIQQLQIATHNKGKFLKGREQGKLLREKYDLDKKDLDKETYSITFQDEVIVLTTSFIVGMFSESIILLQKEGFEQKYKFFGRLSLLNSIDNAVTRILKSHEFYLKESKNGNDT